MAEQKAETSKNNGPIKIKLTSWLNYSYPGQKSKSDNNWIESADIVRNFPPAGFRVLKMRYSITSGSIIADTSVLKGQNLQFTIFGGFRREVAEKIWFLKVFNVFFDVFKGF